MANSIYDDDLQQLLETDQTPPVVPADPELFKWATEHLDKRDQAGETRRRQSFVDTQDVDPERAAAAREMSLRSGQPQSVILRNWDYWKQRDAIEKTPFAAIGAQSPHTAKWLEKPDHAAVATD